MLHDLIDCARPGEQIEITGHTFIIANWVLSPLLIAGYNSTTHLTLKALFGMTMAKSISMLLPA